MAISPLSVLSAAARRALPLIEKGVAQGLSGNAIESLLKGTEYAVRRIELQRAVRAVKGIIDPPYSIKNVRHDRLPDPSRIPEAITKQRRQYAVRTKITGVNSITGAQQSSYITLSFDDMITRNELEDFALELAESDTPSGNFIVEEILLETATRATGERLL